MNEQVTVCGNRLGFIDCVTHTLTGAQILFYLFHTWQSNPDASVILWCRTGDAKAKANAVRVALSKERGARSAPRTFELQFSTHWPYTEGGIKGEAIKVERLRGSMSTRLRAAFLTVTQERKDSGNGK